MDKVRRVLILMLVAIVVFLGIIYKLLHQVTYMTESDIEDYLAEEYGEDYQVYYLTSDLSNLRGDVKNVIQYGTVYLVSDNESNPGSTIKESFEFWVTKDKKIYDNKFIDSYEGEINKKLTETIQQLWQNSSTIVKLNINNTIVYQEDSYLDFVNKYGLTPSIIISTSSNNFNEQDEVNRILKLQEHLNKNIQDGNYKVTIIYDNGVSQLDDKEYKQIVAHMDKNSNRETILESIESASDDNEIE